MKGAGRIRKEGARAARAAHISVPRPRPPARAARSLKAEQAATRDLLARLEAALTTVAELLIEDSAFAPIFLRLEREIDLARAALSDDLLTRARAVLGQNEIGRNKDVT